MVVPVVSGLPVPSHQFQRVGGQGAAGVDRPELRISAQLVLEPHGHRLEAGVLRSVPVVGQVGVVPVLVAQAVQGGRGVPARAVGPLAPQDPVIDVVARVVLRLLCTIIVGYYKLEA